MAQRSGEYKRPSSRVYKCTGCGITITGKSPAKDRNGKRCERIFCSRSCYDSWRLEQRGFCIECGKRMPPMRVKSAKYCSWECRAKSIKATPRNCVACGALFTPVKVMNRRGGPKFISHNAGKTCSRDCQIRWISENEERKRKIGKAFKGEKHPNWQGGKSLLNNIGYRGGNWLKARERALKRDQHKCVDCGISEDECREKYGRGLDVDHIEPFHNFANSVKANRLSNLACRCASCHRIAEAKRTNVQAVLPFADSPSRRHKGRAVGERHPRAKLTAVDVAQIRKAYADGATAASLVKQYPVSSTTMHAICKGEIWKSVPLPSSPLRS